MLTIGTALQKSSTKVLLLGSGELGKEVAIELQRLGIEVIAVDAYADAPAMQVAHRSHVISMLDREALLKVIDMEKPHFVVPEVEAIATDVLLEIEKRKLAQVVPSARAAHLTMNREGIRRLVAEELGIKTSNYLFADTKEQFIRATESIGLPCVIKPIMSSSGKGQSLVRTIDDLDRAWNYSQEGGRSGKGRIIVEGFVDFDFEITLLTVRYSGGTKFCAPIGHIQKEGDYRESWQPQAMSAIALQKSQDIAKKVTDSLDGRGIFGVELFIKGEEVIFSEVSPRPHDTGMVTMISQNLSEFALHVRAFLGLPIPTIQQLAPSASAVILVEGNKDNIQYSNLEEALSEESTDLRLFAKPVVKGKRRMGVALAQAKDTETARVKAKRAASAVRVV